MRLLWIAISAALLAVGVGVVALAIRDDPDPTRSSASSTPAEVAVPDGAAATTALPIGVAQIPGDPAEDVPSALENMRDPAFPSPLVDPDDIRSGGPPPDGIPPIDDPRFEVAAAVDWIDDVEPVLVLEVDGEARAYPIQIMTWHEIVNDTFANTPVTVSYCPLCNSAIAYIRRADGRTFDFGTSGRLYNSSLVMYDRQTQSLWSHFTGQAVIGALTGTAVESLPVTTVSWATFRDAHPDGLVLSRETGFRRDYGRNPYPGYDDVNQVPFLFDGELDGRLPAQTRVIAIRGETETIAVALDDLAAAETLTATVDGKPVVVLHEPGTASALDAGAIADGRDVGATAVYRNNVDGRELDLSAESPGRYIDADTGTVFDILGNAISGELKGTRLSPVEHLDTFWFAIAAFEPDTRIIEP